MHEVVYSNVESYSNQRSDVCRNVRFPRQTCVSSVKSVLQNVSPLMNHIISGLYCVNIEKWFDRLICEDNESYWNKLFCISAAATLEFL